MQKIIFCIYSWFKFITEAIEVCKGKGKLYAVQRGKCRNCAFVFSSRFIYTEKHLGQTLFTRGHRV